MRPALEAQLDDAIWRAIRGALAEDIGSGDATSNSILPPDAWMKGQIIAKQEGVIAGLDVAQACYALYDPTVQFSALVDESAWVRNRQVLAKIEGPARSLLTVERTALNFLGRVSGIASLTRQFVDAIAGTSALILDTRKTAPGLRMLDKLAVRRGGGQNHRTGLFDMILIKDNHIDFAGSISAAVNQARAAQSGLAIEVEARTLADVDEALRLGVERILLDNMSVPVMAQAVQMRDRASSPAKLEASGNVTLETVRSIAESGVDYISSGALTHSAKVFDVSFDVIR
jgi:nicotinate-nucleotide pyrophosphorylase (carboxylating)